MSLTFVGRLATSALALLLAAPLADVAAQDREKIAQKELKAGTKAAAKELKSDLKAASSEFLDRLKEFDGLVKDGTATVDDVLELVVQIDVLQVAVATAMKSAAANVASAKKDALAGLAAASLDGLYPHNFYDGDGGTLDQFRVTLMSTVDKTYVSLRKKLNKTMKTADKAGFGLTFQLRPPLPPPVRIADENITGGIPSPLTIDMIISYSDLAAADDAVVFVGGTATGVLGNIELEVLRVNGLLLVNSSNPPQAGQRWGSLMLAMPEGTFALSAKQGTGSVVGATLGIR